MDEKDLREIFGHRGKRDEFGGESFLAASLRSVRLPPNPCQDAEHWVVVEQNASGRTHVFAVRRSDGYAVALRYEELSDGWYLADISQPTKVAE